MYTRIIILYRQKITIHKKSYHARRNQLGNTDSNGVNHYQKQSLHGCLNQAKMQSTRWNPQLTLSGILYTKNWCRNHPHWSSRVESTWRVLSRCCVSVYKITSWRVEKNCWCCPSQRIKSILTNFQWWTCISLKNKWRPSTICSFFNRNQRQSPSIEHSPLGSKGYEFGRYWVNKEGLQREHKVSEIMRVWRYPITRCTWLFSGWIFAFIIKHTNRPVRRISF